MSFRRGVYSDLEMDDGYGDWLHEQEKDRRLDDSFEAYAREEAAKGNHEPMASHYQHEDDLTRVKQELASTTFFCDQFWKDIEFTDANHSSDTVVWYKGEFLTSKRDGVSAKAFADAYLQKLLEEGCEN